MAVERRGERYAAGLSKMIQQQTVFSPGADGEGPFSRFRLLISELFPHLEAGCRKRDFAGSLLFEWPGRSDQGPLILMSHHDVVGAEESGWRFPPFSGAIADGKVWGRGALDVKGNLFCILQAVEELLAQGVTPPRTVYLISSCMEEVGGNRLVADHLLARGVRPSLLLDEGSALREAPMAGVKGLYALVSVAEKGYADIRLTARGGGGHASDPGKATPLVRLGAFMAAAERKELFPSQMTPVTAEMLRRMAEGAEGLSALRLRHAAARRPFWRQCLPPSCRSTLRTTVAFTMACGSDAPNVLPKQAHVVANLRIAPGETAAGCVRRLRPLALRHGLEMELLRSNGPSPVTDFGGAAFRRVERAVAQVYPEAVAVPYLLSGGTDTKHFTDLCPHCLRFTPFWIDARQQAAIHGVDEHIDISVLPKGVDFYKELILDEEVCE